MRRLTCPTHLLRAVLLALALLLLPLALPGRAHAQPNPPPIRDFGGLIDSINHTQDTNAFLQTLTPLPPPITPPSPIDATTLLHGNDISALNNAIARNAGDIAQMQGLLGQLTVTPVGGPCDLCGQPMPLASFLALQGLSLDRVIAVAVPGSPPIDQGSISLQLAFAPGPPPIAPPTSG